MILYITCKDKKEATKIVKVLLQKKLIVCANLFPITSIFKWKNKIQELKEYVLIIKTSKNFNIIKKEIEKIHSYEIPCIIEIKAKTNEKFDKWIRNETK